jgi:hypothetical protein
MNNILDNLRINLDNLNHKTFKIFNLILIVFLQLVYQPIFKIQINTLLIMTIGLIFLYKAFLNTNLDWVIGPYVAHIIKQTPSTIPMIL